MVSSSGDTGPEFAFLPETNQVTKDKIYEMIILKTLNTKQEGPVIPETRKTDKMKQKSWNNGWVIGSAWKPG